jgi:hypothetical protein
VLFHHLATGTIFGIGGEVSVPTGRARTGLGEGAAVLEPFVAGGQILPSDGFVQAQAGLESPLERDAVQEVFWRAAIGKSFFEGRFGRSWSPMVEVLGVRQLESGRSVLWDVVPQMQVTLSKRQHVMVNAGLRVPLNERAERDRQILMYLLWDWFDGGFFSGWR